MVIGLFLVTADGSRANHEDFGVCHGTSSSGNPFVYISPDMSSGHINPDENPAGPSHADDRAATAEEAVAEECFGPAQDDATDDVTDDATEYTTDDTSDDTTDDATEDGTTDTVDDGTDDDATTDTADDSDEGTDATTLPNTGQGGPTGDALGTTNILLGAFVVLMMMGSWQYRHATRANRSR